MKSRRTALKTGLTALGGLCMGGSLPRALMAQQTAGSDSDRWKSNNGNDIVIHPVNHASLVIETPAGVIYVDPVGDAAAYESLPPPSLILVTHEHGDHYKPDTLAALVTEETQLITNPSVFDTLPSELRDRAAALENGGASDSDTLSITAVPAYNVTPDRLNFHPEGRDNGYVVTVDGTRIYIAGDTEAVPEMRKLSDIDIAFVPMNLPYTMGIEQAADGVLEFAPGIVYPYHYRGKGEISDTDTFASLVKQKNETIQVVLRDWYA